MRWNWMAIWVMAGVLGAMPIGGLGQDGAAGSAADFEDRLLRAELLEVSAGEVQQAMETYRALAADSAAPAPVVARALLYQARCLRKLGQLAEARTLLEDLVQTHAAERDITRQANQFLRELRTGAAENPAFDWLHEMEDNPEIQARVFDLVMDLANTERASAAHRQLLALGPIAYPVMDRMIKTSRDPLQRDWLALAFLQQGRYEYLETLLVRNEPLARAHETMGFINNTLPLLEPEGKSRFLAALDAIPENLHSAYYAVSMRLLAGGYDDLESGLRRYEQLPLPMAIAGGHLGDRSSYRFGSHSRSLVLHVARSTPSGAAAIAARILDDQLDFDMRYLYLDVLYKSARDLIRPAHIASLVRSLSQMMIDDRILALSQNEGFERSRQMADRETLADLLARLLQMDAYDVIFEFLPFDPRLDLEHHYEGLFQELARLHHNNDAGKMDVGWAPILRAEGAWSSLFWFVEAKDEVIPVLLDALQEDPPRDWDGYQRNARRLPDWNPSPAYRQAMVQVLDFESALARAYALEVLSHAEDNIDDSLADRVLAMARNDEDPHVREFAVHTLLAWSPRMPGRSAAMVRALADDYDLRHELGDTPDGYTQIPPPQPPQLPQPRTGRGRLQTLTSYNLSVAPVEETPYEETLNWIFSPWPGRSLTAVALYPEVLRLADAENRLAFLRWYGERAETAIAQETERLASALAEVLADLENREVMEFVVTHHVWRRSVRGGSPVGERRPEAEGRPEFEAFCRRVATDPGFALDVRERAHMAFLGWDWHNWPEFLRSGDPAATRFVSMLMPRNVGSGMYIGDTKSLFWEWLSSLDADEQSAIHDALLACPDPEVRLLAFERLSYKGPSAFEEWIRKALADEDQKVRLEAARRLLRSTRADVAPLFFELLADRNAALRLVALEGVNKFMDARSIEHLVPLLDDPDVRVREAALEALRRIRTALEERDEWRKLVATAEGGGDDE